MHISTVERLPITTTGSPLLVRTKTFQSVFFVIPRERDCHEMHQTLLRLSQPGKPSSKNEVLSYKEKMTNGLTVIDKLISYTRNNYS